MGIDGFRYSNIRRFQLCINLFHTSCPIFIQKSFVHTNTKTRSATKNLNILLFQKVPPLGLHPNCEKTELCEKTTFDWKSDNLCEYQKLVSPIFDILDFRFRIRILFNFTDRFMMLWWRWATVRKSLDYKCDSFWLFFFYR